MVVVCSPLHQPTKHLVKITMQFQKGFDPTVCLKIPLLIVLESFLYILLSHYPPVDLYLISEKSILEKSSSANWIFSLFQTGFLLPVQPAKINFEIDFCRLNIQFDELDFLKIKYRSTGVISSGDLSLY